MSGNIDTRGNVPLWPEPALVLLSGGFDSIAALGWAQIKHARVRAITFSYGQKSRDAEIVSAGHAARTRGVEWTEVCMLGEFFAKGGLLGKVEDHDAEAEINGAFVPGRNLTFLCSALAHAVALWPNDQTLALVIGCCREDAGTFPDCSRAFLESAEHTLSLASGRTVKVVAPWAKMPKVGILDYFMTQQHDDEMVQLMRESWSCYRGGKEPCMRCTACVMRLKALAANGFREDICKAPTMRGGDVHRTKMLSE